MSEISRKCDVLLQVSKEYNLQETDNPAVYTMSLGGGYILRVDLESMWTIIFDDGIEKTEYPIDSVRVPYTNRKDAESLWDRVTSIDPKLQWGDVSEVSKAPEEEGEVTQDEIDKKLIASIATLLGCEA